VRAMLRSVGGRAKCDVGTQMPRNGEAKARKTRIIEHGLLSSWRRWAGSVGRVASALDQAQLDQAQLDQAQLDQAQLDQAQLDQAQLD
jgi:uncharacterized protein YjbI with pentapeptide repeats